MREIKFRAWGASGKSMILAKSICRIHFSEGLPYCILKWDGNIMIRGEVNLMQYTGLKDKNGKEIYEGDIVKGDDYPDGILIVYFGFHETSTDYYASGAYGFYMEKIDGTDSTFAGQFFEDVEVIGNIYENPDLAGK